MGTTGRISANNEFFALFYLEKRKKKYFNHLVEKKPRYGRSFGKH